MKILILGSEGFIGGHCISYFIEKKHEVSGLDIYEQPSKQYDYTKITRLSPEFEEVFRNQFFDAVVNAAGSGNVAYSMQHPLSDFESNCLDTIRVLDMLRKYQPDCRYLHISSAAVYGNPSKLPVHEDDITHPISPYGWHKQIAEQLCKEYTELYNLKTAIARPFSVYGSGLKKQLFWDVYQKIKNSNGTRIELYGTGKESRDYIHISDLVKAIECIIQKGKMNGECYNLASGIEIFIEDVIEIFFEKTSQERNYYFNGKTRHGDPLNWKADINRALALGFCNTVDIKTGLHEVASWLKSIH